MIKISLQKTTILLAWLSVSVAVHSQNPYGLSAGARQAGMAYTTAATTGFWTSFHNQAALAHNHRFSIGINQDNRFGLAELSNKTFGLVIPTGHGSLGAVYSYYGYTEYSRHTAGLAYGMKFGRLLSAGVQADLFSTRAPGDYANTNELTFEAGILFTPTQSFSIGLHTFNPLPDSWRSTDMPAVITLGASYSWSDAFFTAVDLESADTGHNNVRFGMEYRAFGNFYARGGVMTNPGAVSFGVGDQGSVIQGNVGFITHRNLGLTPSLSLVVFIG